MRIDAKIIYLTRDELLAIHADQITRFGGTLGVRSMDQLDSAMARPETGYYAGLETEAAALWESLSQNHPFIDGNKRAAFAATYTFLKVNGLKITATADDLFGFIVDHLARNEFRFDALLTFLNENVELEASI